MSTSTSSCSSVAELAAALRRDASPDLIEFAASAIAELAARKGRGANKSIALTIRNHFDELDDEVRESLRTRAKTIVALIVPERALPFPADEPGSHAPDWTLGAAARHLALHPVTLERRLVSWTYRRLYGWPWHDGHQWWFRSAALDSRTSARVMADMPETEPFHMLPPHCEVQSPPPGWWSSHRDTA